MKRIGQTTRYCLATLALTTFLWVWPAGAQTQSTVPQVGDSDLTRQQLAAFDQFLDNHADLAQQIRSNPSLVNNEEFVESHPDLQSYLQQHPEVREELNQNPNAVMHQEQRFDRREDRDADRRQDRDNGITRGELSNMDSFLDSHPEIAEQLRKNPSLADNKEFVEDHPALQQFLAQHPGVREEIRNNPNVFMSREQRFDRREDMNGVTRGELANMDRFMDSHPEIAEQLRKNPALVNNKDFVEDHPALQQFLAQHPGVREEVRDNPNGFMSREQGFDQREDDRDVTRRELANMDRFMDSHPEIAERLRKNPSLVNNKEFVEDHPALQQFLAQHPGVREQFTDNPNAFMRQEQRFDRREDAGMNHDRDVNRGELSSFHEFLEGHSSVAAELSKKPSLATNEEYLENHSDLQTYLKNNPRVSEELRENPQSFVKSAQTFDETPKAMPKPGSKLPVSDPKLK
ncbi:MAG TPA: hemophore-related protein [Candidatus Sulfotelmatobacter sp.]|nr:hemophore-related protein [Candidatus Sulfotelmatobacter sp.]